MKIRNSQVSVGEKHPSLKKEGAGHVRLTGGPVLFCLLQYRTEQHWNVDMN
jgi:hypothetical protein